MSEEIERAESAPEGSGAGLDPVAVALALGGASQAQADAFLKKQAAFIDEQRHHLRRQYVQLDLGIWQQRLGVLLRLATACVGLGVAGLIAYLIWTAASSNDLVIDAFAVPPQLAARGLSGPVVAAKLSDRIAAMQAETKSQRPPKSYADGISEGLKLEIPDTGISLSELDRFLREKLGHDVHIGGEMVETDKGVAITARAGSEGSATVVGGEADVDVLLQKLAEQTYRITQPYRYTVWLRSHDRTGESIAILKTLAAGGPGVERGWAYNGWGDAVAQLQSELEGLALLRRGHVVDPDNYLPPSNIAATEYRLGRAQESQRDYAVALSLLEAYGRDYALPDRLQGPQHAFRAMAFLYRGALPEAVGEGRLAVATGAGNGGGTIYAALLAEFLAGLHQPGAGRVVLAESPIQNTINVGHFRFNTLRARVIIALEAQDWPGVLAAERELPQVLAKYPGLGESRATMFDPPAALALAHMGRFAQAQTRLDATPSDCYPCLRARAQVAALQGEDARASFWFARAAAIGPSLPYAEFEWGRALLARGRPDAAIEQFRLSNRKGPHFADPLEGWGEALMAKNQSHLALAKFAEAEKYAPNWGRLHLKWGEALVYAGNKEEATAQFARATQLNLTPSEKSELARVSRV